MERLDDQAVLLTKVRPQFFYFSFNGSADSIFSILRIKIKVYFSFCIFKFAADSKYLTIQKKKSSRALKIFWSCRQNRLKSGMSDVYAHCVGHCDRKTSIAKLRFRNSDPDKMFRSLPQLNVWARTRKEAGVSNVCMTQILCFGPSKQNSHTKKVLQDRDSSRIVAREPVKPRYKYSHDVNCLHNLNHFQFYVAGKFRRKHLSAPKIFMPPTWRSAGGI